MFKRSDKSGTRLNVLMIILCIALIGGLGAMWYYNHQIQSQRREELKALSKSNTSLERYFPQEGDAGLEEGGHQVLDGQPAFFLSGDIQNDFSVVHHDQPIAVTDGIPHVVSDHEGHQFVLRHDLL